MNLKIDIVQNEKNSLVTLAGEIDIYTAPELKAALLPLTKTEGQLLEVDLSGIEYMDSTGLGIFVSVLKAAKEYNSHLTLINLDERILRLFKITGLDEVIDIKTTIGGGQE